MYLLSEKKIYTIVAQMDERNCLETQKYRRKQTINIVFLLSLHQMESPQNYSYPK